LQAGQRPVPWHFGHGGKPGAGSAPHSLHTPLPLQSVQVTALWPQ